MFFIFETTAVCVEEILFVSEDVLKWEVFFKNGSSLEISEAFATSLMDHLKSESKTTRSRRGH